MHLDLFNKLVATFIPVVYRLMLSRHVLTGCLTERVMVSALSTTQTVCAGAGGHGQDYFRLKLVIVGRKPPCTTVPSHPE